MNGSSSTTVKVRLTAVCSGLDIAMEKVGEAEPVIQERWPIEPGPVRVAMAPVSLGSEATRLFTLQNRGLTPVSLCARPAVESDRELLRMTQAATLVRGCEIFECGFILSALERRFRGVAREDFTGRVELSAEVPRQFCVPTPRALAGVGNYRNMHNITLPFESSREPSKRALEFRTSVTRRTVTLEPRTVTLKDVVPYSSADVEIDVHNGSDCRVCYTLEVREVLGEMRQLAFEKEAREVRKYAYVEGADDCLVPGLHARLFDPEGVMDEVSAARCP